MSGGEYERAKRDMTYVLEGHYEPSILTMMAGQPYNIKFWEPKYLAPLGIEPGRKPRVLEVRVDGKFGEVGQSHPESVASPDPTPRRRCGAFTRAGISTNPELVIWDPKAIVSMREVQL